MKVKGVNILSFDFKEGGQDPSVSAMIWLLRNSKPELTYADLTTEETEALNEIARSVEQRLLSSDKD